MKQKTPTMKVQTLLCAATFLTICSACADSTPNAEADPVMSGAPESISPEPRLSVGVLEGPPEEQFDQVVSPFLLPSGGLVVPNRGDGTLREFDADGGFVRQLGQEGEGPGEFVWLSSAWANGDTIEALDGRQQRINRFFPDGTAEVVTFGEIGVPIEYGLGPTENGWVGVGIEFIEYGTPDLMRAVAVGRDGTPQGQVAVRDGMMRVRTESLFGPHPLSPAALFVGHGNLVYALSTSDSAVQVLDLDGTTLREIVHGMEPVGTPEDVFQAVLEDVAARAPEGRAAAARARFEGFPAPESVPLVGSMLVDSEGFLWLRPYDPSQHSFALGGTRIGRSGVGGLWQLFSPTGQPAGSIEIPSDLEILSIGHDAVVGVHRDEFGVETVRVHDLIRR